MPFSKKESVPDEDLMPVDNFVLPQISAADLCSEMFTDLSFDFEKLHASIKTDFGRLPQFAPVDVNRLVYWYDK